MEFGGADRCADTTLNSFLSKKFALKFIETNFMGSYKSTEFVRGKKNTDQPRYRPISADFRLWYKSHFESRWEALGRRHLGNFLLTSG